MSIRTRLKELEQRAEEHASHGLNCECRLIHIEEGRALTEEEQRIVEVNKRCFERNVNRKSHVGINTVIVAPIGWIRDEDDDAPLVA